MATVDYLHICDYAFTAENGKACIIGIFEQVNAAVFPVEWPQMALALRVTGRPSQIVNLQVVIEGPTGQPVAGTTIAPPLHAANGTANLNVLLYAVPFPEPGRYTVRVQMDGQVLALQTLRVQRVAAPAADVH